mmetsp:Transcript_38178/g.95282  ORF Transcript_38178/g.95282 Transcript_38178/m.95282 type:complete len:289 (-) Transcript_38178:19-885(-)
MRGQTRHCARMAGSAWRIRKDGQAILWARVGVAAKPLVNAVRVEDVRTRQPARALAHLEVLEADGAGLVNEAVGGRRDRLRRHVPAGRPRLEARARERLGLDRRVEMAERLVIFGRDVAVLQIHQHVVGWEVDAHGRGSRLALRSQVRQLDDAGGAPNLWQLRRGGAGWPLGLGAARRDGDDLRVRRRLPSGGQPTPQRPVQLNIRPRSWQQAARRRRRIAPQLGCPWPRLEADRHRGAAAMADPPVHGRPARVGDGGGRRPRQAHGGEQRHRVGAMLGPHGRVTAER